MLGVLLIVLVSDGGACSGSADGRNGASAYNCDGVDAVVGHSVCIKLLKLLKFNSWRETYTGL